MHCEFHQTGDQQYTCLACGQVVNRAPQAPRANCRAYPHEATGLPFDGPPGCCGKAPGVAAKLWNVAKAAAAFVAQPGFVSDEEYAARLKVCDTCDRRDPRTDTCLECGCHLTLKAPGAAWHCPLNRWPGEPEHLKMDLAAGVAWQTDRSKSVPYDRAYWDKYRAYDATELGRQLTLARVDLVRRFLPPPASVLDVGVGAGAFVRAAAGAGYTATGYDVNRHATKWLLDENRWRDPFLGQTADVDAFALWDVLEHFSDPDDFLARVPAGAFVFLSLPIFAELLHVRKSKHYRPNEHYWYWTHEGLLSWMAARGFNDVYSDQRETDLGREQIRSYVFRKAPAPRAEPIVWHSRPRETYYEDHGNSILLTNGLGDFLAVDSMLGEPERASVRTVYYATRARRAIQELIAAIPSYYNVKHHVALVDRFGAGGPGEPPFSYGSIEQLPMQPNPPGGINDWSISRLFPQYYHHGSSPLDHKLADVSRFDLPRRFSVVHHDSPNDRRPASRGFADRDWAALFRWLEATERFGVLLNAAGAAEAPAHPRLVNLVGQTTILESIEILKRATGYAGIDSWLSVLAAKLFDWPELMLRCHRAHGVTFKHVYWAPRCDRGPRERFIGTHLDELVDRALGPANIS